MPSQHTIETGSAKVEGIFVPLDLTGMQILTQECPTNGVLQVEIIATTTQAACPHCQRISVKIHDTRKRKKRDISLRDHQVKIILLKRRFKCYSCQKPFTEQDTVCGWRKRTTVRLREKIGQQACIQPVAHVANAFEVGPRFVQECLEAIAPSKIEQKGWSIDEKHPLPTPRYLGIDEFARRKGHRYDTILCDLVNRTVLEISEGRKLEEVQKLLERLNDPDAVEAVSMDMSASFRPAVQLCLPKAQIVVDHFHVIQHVSDPHLRR